MIFFKQLYKIHKLPFFFFFSFIFLSDNSFAALKAITFSSPTSVNFGTITSGTTTSTFVLSNTSTMSKTAGDAVYVSGASRGSVALAGSNNNQIQVQFIPTSGSLTGPGTSLTFRNFTSNAPFNLAGTLTIGATLDINGNQTRGTYTGNYIVRAYYTSQPTPTYDSPSMTITTVIRSVVGISQTTGMNFGTILLDPSGGVVDLSSAGVITNSSGNATFFGGRNAAQFSITGEPNQIVLITFSSGNVLTGPGSNIGLGNFNSLSSVTLNGSGAATLNVGAKLTYGSSQVGGTYNGTYTIFANY